MQGHYVVQHIPHTLETDNVSQEIIFSAQLIGPNDLTIDKRHDGLLIIGTDQAVEILRAYWNPVLQKGLINSRIA